MKGRVLYNMHVNLYCHVHIIQDSFATCILYSTFPHLVHIIQDSFATCILYSTFPHLVHIMQDSFATCILYSTFSHLTNKKSVHGGKKNISFLADSLY